MAAVVALGGFWFVWPELRSGVSTAFGGPRIVLSHQPVTYTVLVALKIAAAAACAAVALGFIGLV